MPIDGWKSKEPCNVVAFYPSGQRVFIHRVLSLLWGAGPGLPFVVGVTVVPDANAGFVLGPHGNGLLGGDTDKIALDPRAIVFSVLSGQLLYSGRDVKDDEGFPADMRAWFDVHPEWPERQTIQSLICESLSPTERERCQRAVGHDGNHEAIVREVVAEAVKHHAIIWPQARKG